VPRPELRFGFDLLDDVDVQAVRIEEAEASLAPRLVAYRVFDGSAGTRDLIERAGRIQHLKCQERARARRDGRARRRCRRMLLEYERDRAVRDLGVGRGFC
jgi:hypothetical protein